MAELNKRVAKIEERHGSQVRSTGPDEIQLVGVHPDGSHDEPLTIWRKDDERANKQPNNGD